MAARGQASKDKIKAKIFEVFENAFENGKEIRIPMEENGETIEIKVTLTAAKVNVRDAETMPIMQQGDPSPAQEVLAEPTAEEKENISNLIARLGL